MKFKMKWLLIVFGFLLFVAPVSASVIDDLFSPFDGVDFSRTYDQYSSIIDLVIYTILFGCIWVLRLRAWMRQAQDR